VRIQGDQVEEGGDAAGAYSSSRSSRPLGGFVHSLAEVRGLECCGMELVLYLLDCFISITSPGQRTEGS
jgi:hypothetical protein